MGVYSNPVLADLHKISLSTSKGNEFDVHTSSGNFRCTAREIENFEGATQINLWKTPYYKTKTRGRKSEVGRPKLEDGSWKLEVRSRKYHTAKTLAKLPTSVFQLRS